MDIKEFFEEFKEGLKSLSRKLYNIGKTMSLWLKVEKLKEEQEKKKNKIQNNKNLSGFEKTKLYKKLNDEYEIKIKKAEEDLFNFSFTTVD